MGKKVYANSMEIAHKSGDAKVTAAFPDVCLSPPPPPTGPVPVPYPNTSFAKDLQEGSSTVKIGGEPLALKGKSYYKTSPLGDEAATKNFGGSVLTHTITGKTYFQAHSMNVTVEGKNVCRHLDITTSNHGSQPGSTGPMPSTETMAKTQAEQKKDAKWGHLRGPKRHDCQGKHAWECNKAECPDCWQPPCYPNAEETQATYAESQSGTPAERAAKGKAANQRKFEQYSDRGAEFENKVIDHIGHDNIEHVGYKAHCSACHTIADIDIITKDAVIEVKLSAGLFQFGQMTRNIMSVAKTCFPDKKVVTATSKDELPALLKKLDEKEWAPLALKYLGI
ncbi:DUF4150 domain-containing protein [Archangium sp.]|uniref:DUF4150 domain-containing protein n=1 Tax=Archangium sp. TaxID=1872627 RepID=UPI002D431E4E|nr:DUF4150 domain-containing protein [Archangium sp.]HYO55838.1 DUF4150 domain-containing protein [Archangium sp.]